jgi:hypothetical protein
MAALTGGMATLAIVAGVAVAFPHVRSYRIEAEAASSANSMFKS